MKNWIIGAILVLAAAGCILLFCVSTNRPGLVKRRRRKW